MRLFSIIVLISSVSAVAVTSRGHRAAYMELRGIFERQPLLTPCKDVTAPFTCERSCGPGYFPCVSPTVCYNAGGGDICCSDGTACPAGSYCTNGGCCPNGVPLARCGATITLSIILPPAPAQSTPVVSNGPTSSQVTVTKPATSVITSLIASSHTTSSLTPSILTSSTTPTQRSSISTTSGTPSSIIASPPPKPVTTTPSNSTTTTSRPVQVTANAGKSLNCGNIYVALSGIVVLMWSL